MIVSIAVTKRPSISVPNRVPMIANAPTTTRTSWTSAASAVIPKRKSRKRKVIQSRIPIEPMITRMNACCVSSAEMTGPIVVSERCDSIGPSSASRAVARSPISPVRVTWPGGAGVGGVNDAGGRLSGALGPGVEATGVVAGLPLGEGSAEPDGAGDAEASGLAEGPGLAEGSADPDGSGLPAGGGDASGVSTKPIGFVRMRRKSSVVVWTTESPKSLAARTAFTCSGVTSRSSKRISHFVPPV